MWSHLVLSLDATDRCNLFFFCSLSVSTYLFKATLIFFICCLHSIILMPLTIKKNSAVQRETSTAEAATTTTTASSTIPTTSTTTETTTITTTATTSTSVEMNIPKDSIHESQLKTENISATISHSTYNTKKYLLSDLPSSSSYWMQKNPNTEKKKLKQSIVKQAAGVSTIGAGEGDQGISEATNIVETLDLPEKRRVYSKNLPKRTISKSLYPNRANTIYKSKISYITSSPGAHRSESPRSDYRSNLAGATTSTSQIPTVPSPHASMAASAFANSLFKTLAPSPPHLYKHASAYSGQAYPSTGPDYARGISPALGHIGPRYKHIGPSPNPGPQDGSIFKSSGPLIGPKLPSVGLSRKSDYHGPSLGTNYRPFGPSLGPFTNLHSVPPTSVYKYPPQPSAMTPSYHSSSSRSSYPGPTSSSIRLKYKLYSPPTPSFVMPTRTNTTLKPNVTDTRIKRMRAHPTLKPEHIKQLPIIRRIQQSPNRNSAQLIS